MVVGRGGGENGCPDAKVLAVACHRQEEEEALNKFKKSTRWKMLVLVVPLLMVVAMVAPPLELVFSTRGRKEMKEV